MTTTHTPLTAEEIERLLALSRRGAEPPTFLNEVRVRDELAFIARARAQLVHFPALVGALREITERVRVRHGEFCPSMAGDPSVCVAILEQARALLAALEGKP